MGEEKKKKNKTPLLIFLIAFVFTLLGYVGGYYFGQAVLKRDGLEPKKEEKKKEKAKLTEAQAKEIYLRYHSKLESDYNIGNYIYFMDNAFEYSVYSSDSFKVKDLKNVGYTIANRIYDDIKDQIKDKEKTYPKGTDYAGMNYYEVADVEKYVKEDFKKLFGNNLEYNIDLFNGCHVLTIGGNSSEKKRFDMKPMCGGITTTTFTYEMTGFEEKDDKLYITEKVTFKLAPDNSSTPTINEETYKWTYSKYEDTYVLLQVDKIKK